jgi:hypothetical protein
MKCTKEMYHVCNILLGKPEGMRPLGKPMQRQENDIKTDLKENNVTEWIGFIGLIRGPVADPCGHKSKKREIFTTLATTSFSRTIICHAII